MSWYRKDNSMVDTAMRVALSERHRCVLTVAKGTPVSFWETRLRNYAESLERAAAYTRETMEILKRYPGDR